MTVGICKVPMRYRSRDLERNSLFLHREGRDAHMVFLHSSLVKSQRGYLKAWILVINAQPLTCCCVCLCKSCLRYSRNALNVQNLRCHWSLKGCCIRRRIICHLNP